MFKEIAVEPAAVAASDLQFRYILEKFGVAEGRLIAAFPSKWKRFVYQAAQARLRGTAELSKIEVRLRGLTDDFFYFQGRPGDGCAENWLAAAEAEHARVPFDAIIAAEGNARGAVVPVQELDATHPCLHPNRQWHIERTAEAMTHCCAPLLRTGSHIKLIDPHLDANNGRHRRPLVAFIRSVKPGARVDVFRGDTKSQEHLCRGIERALKEAKAEGVEVRLYLRPQATLHNRYVLTQGGGMFFSTGLDDHDDGENRTDEVGVLEAAIWTVQWEKYSGDDPVACWR
jgi:hypothetical protein